MTSATFAPDIPTDQVISEVLAEHKQVAANLAAAHAAAWDAVDPVVLELCRLRIAQLLENPAELAIRTSAAAAAGLDEAMIAELSMWPSSPRFGSRERACLALCEQSLIDVGNVTSQQTESVAVELGVQGLADFVSGLLVVEQRQRLRLVWERLFGSTRVEGDSNGL